MNALARDHQVPFELSDVVNQTYRRALARYDPVDRNSWRRRCSKKKRARNCAQAQLRTSDPWSLASGRLCQVFTRLG